MGTLSVRPERSRRAWARIKRTRSSVSAVGPLCSFANARKCAWAPPVRVQGMGLSGAGRRRRRPAARGALRCSPWGRAAKLASLTAFVALEQLRRVRSRSARVRAPTPRLRSSPSPTPPGPGQPHALRARSFLGEGVWQAAGIEPTACRAPQARHRVRAGLDARLLPFHSPKEQVVLSQAVGGCAVARLCGGEERRVSVGARTRALRELTHRICPSATNAVSAASYAVRPTPEHRSAVGAPLAPTAAPARHRTRAHGLAQARTSTLRTFKDRNGPRTDSRFMRRGSRKARWGN
jgi:hypothetical protein